MTDAPITGPAEPTPPIALAEGTTIGRLDARRVEVDDATLARLTSACAAVTTDAATVAETSRDWWPLAMTWALEGQVGGLASVVCRPSTPDEVAAVAAICDEARIPLTVTAGRSGVGGGSVPLHGGVALDLCGLSGIVDIDDHSLVARVRAGTFGDHFEHELRTTYGLTAGHWPQSMTLATVGGWLACRGAGQLSTRYGKIEDIVCGLDVVLANGRRLHTGGSPRQAAGPDLNQLFVGSEGTLGVIVEAELKLHPAPTHERRGAWGFASFGDGLEACRRILRRGATPAVLRLYDEIESDRNYHTGDSLNVVVALDEGDEPIVEGSWAVVEAECAGAERLGDDLVEHWLGKRNDVSQLEVLIAGGLVVDTMEISAPWSRLDRIYADAVAAISAIDGVLAVSAHQSHAYTDGACLYFTFAGKPEPGAKDEFYRAVWDAGTLAVLAAGGSLSHHHGVGLNRSRYMAQALGGGMDVLAAIKAGLDPNGILNPGKLGLPDPFGTVVVP
ncbi:MAG: FAD-binding oxidoreductase [Acidimicrobiales bacterium]